MTQRNFQNARNQGDGPKGKSRKSASSAKLKSKAGASVYAPTKEAKAQRAKQEAKARKSQPAEAKANDPIVTVIPAAARIIMSFRPLRSAKFPHIGATIAEAKAVTDIARPENNST